MPKISLIEVMIIVAIVAILAAIAIPNFVKFNELSRAKSEATEAPAVEGPAERNWN